ncbi:hypothetical protein [Achromobacter ruhlandii]|uniref:hypothetical protein n=1 Tax=Achromobacter ruhlandii TaxID=72557 RepID=UPI0022B8A2BB|nr:hypothetical protein [Achromobacter ruhlandii]MCZ8434534.1 hypothetical protein [Achromobacter ruhlandii]MDD7983086.1 hypothetical protein [Achromobacter ruhlandii]
MPYIDPTGTNPGWSDEPQPGFNLTQFVDEAPPVGAQVPAVVSRRQGRLALLEVGRLDAVESAISAIEDPVKRRAAQIEYEADSWERSNQFLVRLWADLGGTSAGLDDLFMIAATK